MKNQLILFSLTTAFMAACAYPEQQASNKTKGIANKDRNTTRTGIYKTGEKEKKDTFNVLYRNITPDPGNLAISTPLDPIIYH